MRCWKCLPYFVVTRSSRPRRVPWKSTSNWRERRGAAAIGEATTSLTMSAPSKVCGDGGEGGRDWRERRSRVLPHGRRLETVAGDQQDDALIAVDPTVFAGPLQRRDDRPSGGFREYAFRAREEPHAFQDLGVRRCVRESLRRAHRAYRLESGSRVSDCEGFDDRVRLPHGLRPAVGRFEAADNRGTSGWLRAHEPGRPFARLAEFAEFAVPFFQRSQ